MLEFSLFTSFLDNSLKGSERATRIAAAGGIIRLARIRSDTKVPEQMPKFWACSANKEKFQSFVTSHVLDLARKIKISIIFSGTVVENVSKPALHLNELGNVQQIDQLNFKYEEADLRIIPHIGWEVT